jgi:5-methylcytosine-specific restriction endonuclease McrA
MVYFVTNVTEEVIKKEKAKARKLKKSQWWKRRCADGTCYFCKKKVSPKKLTLDHIVPLIRGGKSTKGNVVPACKDCNNKKRYLLPFEWDEYMESLKNCPLSSLE